MQIYLVKCCLQESLFSSIHSAHINIIKGAIHKSAAQTVSHQIKHMSLADWYVNQQRSIDKMITVLSRPTVPLLFSS